MKINDQLGANDRHRVDEYLTSIREIEHRLDAPPTQLADMLGIAGTLLAFATPLQLSNAQPAQPG